MTYASKIMIIFQNNRFYLFLPRYNPFPLTSNLSPYSLPSREGWGVGFFLCSSAVNYVTYTIDTR